jgi:hypothetical protein
MPFESGKNCGGVAAHVIRQAPCGGLEEIQIIPSTVKDAMHQDCLSFDGVDNQVVFNYEVAVSDSK